METPPDTIHLGGHAKKCSDVEEKPSHADETNGKARRTVKVDSSYSHCYTGSKD